MVVALERATGSQCRVFTSDVKVRIEASNLSTFPDVSVVCDPQQTSPIDSNALTNPTLLVEVTSRSTEDYDRGDKLSHYKQLASLRAVIFVSHRAPAITVVERGPSGWREQTFRGGERVGLESLDVHFAVDDVYARIALDA
jgi:Uma2 family endonuclease